MCWQKTKMKVKMQMEEEEEEEEEEEQKQKKKKKMEKRKRAHPDLNQGPADLQSAALTTELCTLMHLLSVCVPRPCCVSSTWKSGRHVCRRRCSFGANCTPQVAPAGD